MKALHILVVCLAVALLAAPVFGQQIKLSGPHYNLNIIGVENEKNAPMNNSERHTIFVALGSKGRNAVTNIYLQPGYDFKVCDGNGFDAAYDCDGAPIKSYKGAAFQLPCNTYYTDYDIGCPADVAQRSYVVYARALGKPGGSADVMTCATDLSTGEVVCSTENILTLTRKTGRSLWQDATSELTTLQADIDGDGRIEKIALFADGFEDFFWNYSNKGLRLAQLRFYSLVQ